jgi:hypothetical protein
MNHFTVYERYTYRAIPITFTTEIDYLCDSVEQAIESADFSFSIRHPNAHLVSRTVYPTQEVTE